MRELWAKSGLANSSKICDATNLSFHGPWTTIALESSARSIQATAILSSSRRCSRTVRDVGMQRHLLLKRRTWNYSQKELFLPPEYRGGHARSWVRQTLVGGHSRCSFGQLNGR